jgi:hypothetical protein
MQMYHHVGYLGGHVGSHFGIVSVQTGTSARMWAALLWDIEIWWGFGTTTPIRTAGMSKHRRRCLGGCASVIEV